MHRKQLLRLLVALHVVLSLALLAGCKKNVTPTPPVEPASGRPLSLSTLMPSEGTTDKPTPITLTGDGFQAGLQVLVGDAPALDVELLSGKVRATVPSGMQTGRYDITVRNSDGKQATLPSAFTVRDASSGPVARSSCELGVIYFAFDDDSLDDEARAALQKSADCVRARGIRKLRAEGHCDERGSTDYNLALGQRRADSVRRYLLTLGVSDVSTLSYGEEQPAVTGEGEDAWSRNRRVELIPVDGGVAQQ